MTRAKVILIGSAGSGTAFSALAALRRVWGQEVRAVAMDLNPGHLVTASLLADRFEQVPASAAPEFAGALLEIIGRHQVDTYLPLLPEETFLAARLRDEGRLPAAARLMAPPLPGSAACMDKLLLSQVLKAHGLPVPASASASAPLPAGEVFLKPRTGCGSRGARRVNPRELAEATARRPGDWLVQELCAGPEVTVDSFFDPADGFLRVLCRERIVTKAGVTTKARLFEDRALAELALGIARALGLQGSFCFQVMGNGSGWAVTDVNARPGAATAMCALTGNDFFAASFALCWGEDARAFFRPLAGDQYVTRQYADFLMGPAETP
jgi:carbamoylphosphate synthase large subunit